MFQIFQSFYNKLKVKWIYGSKVSAVETTVLETLQILVHFYLLHGVIEQMKAYKIA